MLTFIKESLYFSDVILLSLWPQLLHISLKSCNVGIRDTIDCIVFPQSTCSRITSMYFCLGQEIVETNRNEMAFQGLSEC